MIVQNLEDIYQITVHCSATKESIYYDVEDIDRWHKARGFAKQPGSNKYCGYHFVVLLDGTIQAGRLLTEVGAHSIPNTNKIGICYIGGLDKDEQPKDTRTDAQKTSMHSLCKTLKVILPCLREIKGHRDNSKDLNNDGIIDPFEWQKVCPCFEAIPEFSYLFENGN